MTKISKVFTIAFSATVFAITNLAVAEEQVAAEVAVEAPANPCVTSDQELSDNAFWAISAVDQFGSGNYEQSVSTVNACFDLWAPEAASMQTALNEKGKKCPATGQVDRREKRRINKNHLINDVSAALWAKARSLDELGKTEEAKQAYSQCIYMACGRVWDPQGWYWSPAEDCLKKAQKLVKQEAN